MAPVFRQLLPCGNTRRALPVGKARIEAAAHRPCLRVRDLPLGPSYTLGLDGYVGQV
jgi:hypothetical protein